MRQREVMIFSLLIGIGQTNRVYGCIEQRISCGYDILCLDVVGMVFHLKCINIFQFLGPTRPSGDLLQWDCVRHRPPSVDVFLPRTTGPILTKFDM